MSGDFFRIVCAEFSKIGYLVGGVFVGWRDKHGNVGVGKHISLGLNWCDMAEA